MVYLLLLDFDLVLVWREFGQLNQNQQHFNSPNALMIVSIWFSTSDDWVSWDSVAKYWIFEQKSMKSWTKPLILTRRWIWPKDPLHLPFFPSMRCLLIVPYWFDSNETNKRTGTTATNQRVSQLISKQSTEHKPGLKIRWESRTITLNKTFSTKEERKTRASISESRKSEWNPNENRNFLARFYLALSRLVSVLDQIWLRSWRRDEKKEKEMKVMKEMKDHLPIGFFSQIKSLSQRPVWCSIDIQMMIIFLLWFWSIFLHFPFFFTITKISLLSILFQHTNTSFLLITIESTKTEQPTTKRRSRKEKSTNQSDLDQAIKSIPIHFHSLIWIVDGMPMREEKQTRTKEWSMSLLKFIVWSVMSSQSSQIKWKSHKKQSKSFMGW